MLTHEQKEVLGAVIERSADERAVAAAAQALAFDSIAQALSDLVRFGIKIAPQTAPIFNYEVGAGSPGR